MDTSLTDIMDNLHIYKFKGFCSLFMLLHLSKVTKLLTTFFSQNYDHLVFF